MSGCQLVRGMPLFAALADERWQWLEKHMGEVTLAAGELLVSEGEPGKGFFILYAGELLITKRADGADMPAGRHVPPSFIGEIQVLSGLPTPVSVRAATKVEMVRMDDDAFRELLSSDRNFAQVVFRTMAARVSGMEAFVRQREKMAALGTLSAGLAHELNNPIAAVASATGRLRERSREVMEAALAFALACPDAAAVERVRALYERAAADGAPPVRDAIAESEREDLFADWFDDRAVGDGWKLAPAFAATGLEPSDLDALAAAVPAGALVPTLQWLASTFDANALVEEAGRAATRVADIVKAMKSYSYMDQGPRQDVDLHEGLEDTLTILRHKLRHGIEVIRDYDRAIPRMDVFGSELNQVWTNLIDNAIDAMDGKGTLTLRTRSDGRNVIVEVCDTGPGVPPAIQARIFEPFFTTKPVGKGTGLGLEIAWRTVVNRHGGSLRLSSQPGDTRFQVVLPA